MVAVEHDPIGLEALGRELGERPRRRDPQRRGHAEEVALLVARVADPDAARPRAHARRAHLALGRGEQLGVLDAGQVLRRCHDRPDRHRAGPGAPADLVDPDHDPIAGFPALPLVSQRRERSRHARGR